MVKREVSALSKMPHFELELTEVREWRGSYSGYSDSGEMVFTNMASWELFWQNHTSIQEPQPPLPVIDFNADMIVAIFMGQKATGGYSTKIVDIESSKKEITVKYIEVTPAPGAMLTQALTQPYHIKVIEKSALPVVFRKVQ